MPKEQFKLKKGELNSAWKKAHAGKDEFAGGGFDVFEDGRYAVALTDAIRSESKSSGRDQVGFEFTFIDGDYKGKKKWDFNGLDRAESLPFLIRKIESMGYEAPDTVDGLEDVLTQMAKDRPQFRVQLKTKGEFQNVYIDRKLNEEAGEGAGENAPPAEEPKRGKVGREPAPAPAPEPEAAPAGGDDDLSVGMLVRCMEGEDEVGKGTVVAIDEENAEVTVKMENGKKQIFPAADLRLPAKEAPKKKGLKVGR
jgi:hypothetical protein